jgi:hypothetical protein
MCAEEGAMSDLRSSKLIVAKGIMFLAIAVLSACLVLLQLPSLKVALLLALVAWASARFYYFLFYVLERYVDPTMRYSGIANLVLTLLRRGEPGA